jgi:hypothetical protein
LHPTMHVRDVFGTAVCAAAAVAAPLVAVLVEQISLVNLKPL